MRVKELSERSGVAPHVIRYYTRLGLLHPVRERRNRYRTYAAADVERIRFIRGARWLGFTLKDLEIILANADLAVSPRPEVCELIARRTRESRERLHAVNRLQRRMESAVSAWSSVPDQPPTQVTLRRLIDLVAREDLLLT